MTIRIVRHIPGFVDRGDTPPETAEVETLDELLAVDWVASWAMPLRGEKPFYRWSISADADRRYLMAEFDRGREWWVVGNVSGDRVALPLWHAP